MSDKKKPNYRVFWTKTYYQTGMVEVDAETMVEAEEKVRNMIGDLEGSMQYDADADHVDARANHTIG